MKPTTFPNTGYRKPKSPNPNNITLESIQTPLQTTLPSVMTDISMNPLPFQMQQPDCVENGVTWAKQWFDYQSAKVLTPLSIRFLAAVTVVADNIPYEDGTNLEVALRVAEDSGICEESLYATDSSLSTKTFIQFNSIPGTAFENALTHKVGSAVFLTDKSAQGLRNAIQQNGLVIICVEIDDAWWTNKSGTNSWAANDILPIRPPVNKPTESGHCIVLYGYDQNYFYFANWWSTQWGNNGLGYFGINELPFISEAAVLL
jgi:hypothetical protein